MNEDMVKLFRWLVIATLVFNIFWAVFPYLWNYIYSNEEIDLILQDGMGGSLSRNLTYIFGAAYILLSIGLLRLKYWAKVGFAIFIFLSLILSPFFGVSVLGRYDVFLSSIIGLSYGVILTLAFLLIKKPV